MRTSKSMTRGSKPHDEQARAARRAAHLANVQAARVAEAARAAREAAAKEAEAKAWRELKLPAVESYALCDGPGEEAACKAFADAMFQRITGRPYRSHLEAQAAASSSAASSSAAGGVGQ